MLRAATVSYNAFTNVRPLDPALVYTSTMREKPITAVKVTINGSSGKHFERLILLSRLGGGRGEVSSGNSRQRTIRPVKKRSLYFIDYICCFLTIQNSLLARHALQFSACPRVSSYLISFKSFLVGLKNLLFFASWFSSMPHELSAHGLVRRVCANVNCPLCSRVQFFHTG